MSPEKEALAVFWTNKRFWLFYSLGVAAWILLALSWFWLPDSTVWGILLSAVHGLVVIGSALWLIRKALRFYNNAHGGCTWKALRRPRLYPSLLLLALIGSYIPYKLIGWHPQLPGFTLQTASLIIRFTTAYLLAVSAWLILASLMGRLGTDPQATPAPASPAPLAPQTAQPNQ